jgi:hypothetical protein
VVSIVTTTINPMTVNQPFTQTIQVSDVVGTVAFSLTDGSFPPGISLNTSTGVLSGTPAIPNAYDFVITVTDTSGSDSREYSILVADDGSYTGLTITTLTINPMTVNQPFTQTLQSRNSQGSVVWALVDDDELPLGLSLNPSTGVISGTPLIPSSYQFDISLTDTVASTSRSYTATVANDGSFASISISTTSISPFFINAQQSIQIQVINQYGTVNFSVSSGRLPFGLSLNPATGLITGITQIPATYNFVISVTDQIGDIAFTDTQSYTVEVLNDGSYVPPLSLPFINLGFGLINQQLSRASTATYSIDDEEGRKVARAGGTGQNLTPRTEIRLSTLRGHARSKKTITGTQLGTSMYQEIINIPQSSYTNGFTYVTLTIADSALLGGSSNANSGLLINANSPGNPGFSPLDYIEVVNRGRITGKGGNGGQGNPTEDGGFPGQPGGPGIDCNVPLFLINYSIIAGGGGGGGGGPGDDTRFFPSAQGGGGGGGAGWQVGSGNSWGPSSPGTLTTGGPGAPGQRRPPSRGGPGGPGGNLGQAGTPAGGQGGAAGRAIVGVNFITLTNSGPGAQIIGGTI